MVINLSRVFLFGILIVICVINVLDVDSAAVKLENGVYKVEKRTNHSFIQLLGNIAGALARQDLIQAALDVVRIIKKNDNGNLIEGILIVAEGVLNTVHPGYVFLFPSKEDKGSLMGNLNSGMGSWLESARQAGKAAQIVNKALGFLDGFLFK